MMLVGVYFVVGFWFGGVVEPHFSGLGYWNINLKTVSLVSG